MAYVPNGKKLPQGVSEQDLPKDWQWGDPIQGFAFCQVCDDYHAAAAGGIHHVVNFEELLSITKKI